MTFHIVHDQTFPKEPFLGENDFVVAADMVEAANCNEDSAHSVLPFKLTAISSTHQSLDEDLPSSSESSSSSTHCGSNVIEEDNFTTSADQSDNFMDCEAGDCAETTKIIPSAEPDKTAHINPFHYYCDKNEGKILCSGRVKVQIVIGCLLLATSSLMAYFEAPRHNPRVYDESYSNVNVATKGDVIRWALKNEDITQEPLGDTDDDEMLDMVDDNFPTFAASQARP